MAVGGAIVTGAGALAKAILQLLAVVVLARLLSPQDFGIMAMVFPLIAFATVFQQAGLGSAVLQRETLTHQELSTIFWTNAAIGSLLCGLLVVVAPWVAHFYHEPRVLALTKASGLLMMLGALSSQHLALLSRQMKFSRLALIDVLSLTIGTSTGIISAYIFGSYWAIFFLSFGTSASMCFFAWMLNGWRPGRMAPLQHIKDVLLFGGHITASNLATYFGRNLDNILIGRWIGSVALGYYERAYKVVLLPVLFVHMPLYRVLVPMLSQARQNQERYRQLFILGFQLSLFMTFPGTFVLIVAAREIVLIVMGEQWLVAAPIFSWLALATLAQLATGPLSMIFVSQDRSREAMISSIVSSLFSSMAFVIGLQWGAVGVAAVYAISELIRTPVMLWYATRKGPVAMRDTTLALMPFLLAAILGALIFFWWKSNFARPASPLLFIVVVGAMAYSVTFLCLLLNRTSRAFLTESFTVLGSLLRPKR